MKRAICTLLVGFGTFTLAAALGAGAETVGVRVFGWGGSGGLYGTFLLIGVVTGVLVGAFTWEELD